MLTKEKSNQPYEETLISEYWFRTLINIDDKKVSIKNISALIAAFGASFEHFDKSIETWSFQIVNDDLKVERIPEVEYSPSRRNQAHFGIIAAKPGAKYHWKLKCNNNNYEDVWIGVVEADKANVDYTNFIKNKGVSYLWYSGGYYHYGIDQKSYLMSKYIYILVIVMIYGWI